MKPQIASHPNHAMGVPCQVDTAQPDPVAAGRFYGGLFGWTFDDDGAPTAGGSRNYLTARLNGEVVSGIVQAPPEASAALWRTHVRVADLDRTVARAEQLGGNQVGGAVDVGSYGRLASLQDSSGVPLCLWQPGTRMGAEVTGEPGSWAMSSLHTTDLDQAAAFYGTLFGWELDDTPGALFLRWRVSNRVVAVVTATDGRAVPAHWAVNFAVQDADGIAERALTLGGTLIMAPMDTPGFRNAVLTDPQGGFIAISAKAPE